MNCINNTPDSSGNERKPAFSIIIPVYNAAGYLRECLDSIRNQTFSDWEAVIVDDCSSDTSAEIAGEYIREDPRIRLYTSETNSGGAYAPRLRAARLAKADHIVTIDADDTVSPDLLESLHTVLISSGADLVLPELWRMDKLGVSRLLPADSIDTEAIWNGRDLIVHTLIKWDIPMCGFAARRDLYLEADSHVTAEDRKSIFSDELQSRWLLALCGKVAMCGGRYYYRRNDTSVTNINLLRIISSKMLTCDGLTAMASSTFGEKSPTYTRALEEKLYSAVDLLRLINRKGMKGREKHEAMEIISSSMKGFDLARLKGKTSPRYLALMRLPIPLARLALRILDPILRK